MKILKNNYDKEIGFTNLEEAKNYYLGDVIADEEDYLGDNFEFYKKSFDERQKMISSASNFEELAEALNYMSDTLDNGSTWFVQEV